MTRPSPAIFLDRDGTVIENVPYLGDPAKVRLTPHAGEGLRLLDSLGFILFIVSNQSGIARGLITQAQCEAVNQEMLRQAAEAGAQIRKCYFCPHHPKFGSPCSCRKPDTGMLETACRENLLDLGRSFVIGDSDCDIEMAHSFNLPAVRLADGADAGTVPAEHTAPDLLAAARWIQARMAQQ